jgi:iron-sulfur cluster repair protein YtfE (RIC family)
MENFRNRRIKDVLREKPELAEVLKKYDINCHSCTGNCITKDVTEEHNLSMKEEIDFDKNVSKVLLEDE